MHIVEDVLTLAFDDLEQIERLTLRWIFQAVLDFGMDAYEVFLKSPDDVKDVAEDITRELLDRLPGFNVPQRIFGTVDYKRARYVILPDRIVRQALLSTQKLRRRIAQPRSRCRRRRCVFAIFVPAWLSMRVGYYRRFRFMMAGNTSRQLLLCISNTRTETICTICAKQPFFACPMVDFKNVIIRLQMIQSGWRDGMRPHSVKISAFEYPLPV